MKLILLSKDDQYPLKIDQYITGYKMKIETDPKANARVHFSNLEMMVTLEAPHVDRENEHLKAQIETLIQWALLPFSPENHYYRDLALHMTVGNGFEKTIVLTHAKLHMTIENSTKKNYEVLTIIAKQKIDKTEGVLFGVDLEETYEKAWAITSNRLQRNIVASLSPFERNATMLASLPSLGGNTLMFHTKFPSLRPKEDYDYKYKVIFKTGNILDHKGTYYEIKENKTGKYITISSKIVYLSEFLKDGYKIAGQETNVVEPKYINTISGKKTREKRIENNKVYLQKRTGWFENYKTRW